MQSCPAAARPHLRRACERMKAASLRPWHSLLKAPQPPWQGHINYLLVLDKSYESTCAVSSVLMQVLLIFSLLVTCADDTIVEVTSFFTPWSDELRVCRQLRSWDNFSLKPEPRFSDLKNSSYVSAIF